MDIFERCKQINNNIDNNNENTARNDLIQLLDNVDLKECEYSALINHLIRKTGLFPYINVDTAIWEDQFVYDIFKVDVGFEKPVTLHRAQSLLLKKLINNENIAVSAPTSFGKSFVIDAFISIKKPNNVVIIVPTIALTDETRRRIYTKFAHLYKIITTTEVELSDNNIFIFPQERAINYVNKIKNLDLLIIDEFYKASTDFDKERAPALIKAILQLGEKAKQKYFLAPNISTLKANPFTEDMEFCRLDFNTVFLEKYDLYKKINKDLELKSKYLLEILNIKKTKTLIYAGTYADIDRVSDILIENIQPTNSELLNDFADWLTVNYNKDWKLIDLINRATGIHNGQLHRSLSQLQIKLFEEKIGLDNIVSTSSIIEGVNTSAENVIIWRNKNGRSRLNDFTYKNIMGRGGRMFRHFIGKIYILEDPPIEDDIQLQIEFPENLLSDMDEEKYESKLSQKQISEMITYKKEMYDLLGKEVYDRLLKENAFQLSNSELIKSIATDMLNNPSLWNGLSYLNSEDVSSWESLLYKIIRLQPAIWGIEYRKFVFFIQVLSNNWQKSIPDLLDMLSEQNIGINDFFKLERYVTFNFSALANDINVLQKEILKDKNMDISPFISKLSHAFLPSVVYQLEEYGMPRMISKKIYKSNLINFLNSDLTIHKSIDIFNKVGKDNLIKATSSLDDFDRYIIDYFYDGITVIKNGK